MVHSQKGKRDLSKIISRFKDHQSFFFLLCVCLSQLVDKYIKDATTLMASEEANDVASALPLLDAALSISPRLETALELKARSLLFLRRFKDVADMLQDYIPSLKLSLNDEEGSASSQGSSSDGLNLLSDASSPGSFKCFSVSDLKKKVMAGICKKCDKQGQWRSFFNSLLYYLLTFYQNAVVVDYKTLFNSGM